MREYGIDDGDVIVVDRMLRARDWRIVVAIVESMELVIALAAETAAQVHRAVSNAVDADKWQHSRYLLNLNYDTGPPGPPRCQADCDRLDGVVLQQPAAVHCRRRDHQRD